MKIILAAGAVVIAVLAVLLLVLEPASAPSVIEVPEANRPIVADIQPTTTRETGKINTGQATTPSTTGGKLKVETFTGTLQEVNTGCFSDGECYVVVNGRHITAILGRSQEMVGKVVGVDGFGDLERFIGKQVEVYAKDNGDTLTLYGSEGFYIKVITGV